VDNVPNWKDVSPRLGFAYDVFGDGRTAIKGNVGGFPLVTGLTNFTRVANPMATTVNTVSRTWSDHQRQLRAGLRPSPTSSPTASASRCRT
jgi:hypothetical protein